jgi:oligopeptide/dipeptide ABC transporter ATP-binding protein
LSAAGATGPDPLVEVEGLVRHFRLGRSKDRIVRAVEDVSFAIPPGETFGLVGESGSGKSTVARLILRLDSPNAGRVLFDGADIHALDRRDLQQARRQMQIVLQDPYSALNRRKTVDKLIGLPLSVHRVGSRAERRARVRELLGLVGLRQEHLGRFPHQLSGGQCQRVGIARAIALEPRLVVLDEAVSAVDVSIQAQVLNLLRELQGRLGLTYLFISHDLAVVRYMASTIGVMYLGRIVELGPREILFREPRHPYTHALMGAVPVPDPVVERARRRVIVAADDGEGATGCPFQPRCPLGRERERCGVERPELTEIAPRHRVACHFPESGDSLLRDAAAP